uniref:RRM domain-containing protein n=1 Tax=Eutreptiella gymnastica TaxID=73025 RepID=A0A7S1HX02_9EUGL|mmetsp:Transcript_111686/g.193851  ORF Transcript_111686/g.193851 Transcript_111686/m.193851 type:complete len:292 (+) Transcript_111686:45-920(+)
MNNIQESMSKLDALLSSGMITADEFAKKRQSLVDQFVGIGNSTGARTQGNDWGQGNNGGNSWGTGGGSWGKGFGRPKGAWSGGGQNHYHPYGKGWGKGKGKGGNFGGKGGNRSGRSGASKGPSKSIKISPVPQGMHRDQLSELFSAYGEVESCVVNDGAPKYGFINFVTEDSAKAAAAMDRIELLGEWCTLTLSKGRGIGEEGAPPSTGVGLFNLPFKTTHDELEQLMATYTGKENIKMVYRQNGEFRGYAFVYFDSVENATNAKDALQGLVLGTQAIDVKFASKTPDGKV